MSLDTLFLCPDMRAGGAELSDAVMVHTLLMRPEDADGLIEVFDEFPRTPSLKVVKREVVQQIVSRTTVLA